jgi:hypothetical protein
MARYILLQPHFIGGTLLAAGSIVTDEDLGEGVEAGNEMVEVNAKGQPKSKEDADRLRGLGIPTEPIEVAPVSPHAPNPTMPQALPPHGIGEVEPAGNFVPADGVESDEAAAARAEQQDAASTTPQRRKKQ